MLLGRYFRPCDLLKAAREEPGQYDLFGTLVQSTVTSALAAYPALLKEARADTTGLLAGKVVPLEPMVQDLAAALDIYRQLPPGVQSKITHTGDARALVENPLDYPRQEAQHATDKTETTPNQMRFEF